MISWLSTQVSLESSVSSAEMYTVTEEQIVGVLKQAEAGVPVKDLYRKIGISDHTFYNWKAKYRVLGVSELRRLRELGAENARLKKMYADLALENETIKAALNRKLYTV